MSHGKQRLIEVAFPPKQASIDSDHERTVRRGRNYERIGQATGSLAIASEVIK